MTPATPTPRPSWRKEGKDLPAFHRRGAAIIAQVNGDEAAFEYVRAAKELPAQREGAKS